MAEEQKNTGAVLQDFGQKLIDLGKKHEEKLQLLREIQNVESSIHLAVSEAEKKVDEMVNKHSAAVAGYQKAILRGDEKKTQDQRKEIQAAVKAFDDLSVDLSTLESKFKMVQKRGHDLYISWISISNDIGNLRNGLILCMGAVHSEHPAASYVRDAAEQNITVCEKLLSKIKTVLSDDG